MAGDQCRGSGCNCSLWYTLHRLPSPGGPPCSYVIQCSSAKTITNPSKITVSLLKNKCRKKLTEAGPLFASICQAQALTAWVEEMISPERPEWVWSFWVPSISSSQTPCQDLPMWGQLVCPYPPPHLKHVQISSLFPGMCKPRWRPACKCCIIPTKWSLLLKRSIFLFAAGIFSSQWSIPYQHHKVIVFVFPKPRSFL